MNINTNAQTQKPFYPLTVIMPHSSYFAVKAANDLSILKVQDKDITVFNSLMIEEFKNTEGFIPVQFNFVKEELEEKSSILVAYENGKLIQMNFFTKEIIKILNNMPINSTHKQASMIINDPINKYEFFIVYEDSTVLKYGVKYEESQYFLEKISKFEQKTSFNPINNRFKYKHKDNDFLEMKKATSNNLPELHFFYALNKDPHQKNPISYHKFSCNKISHMEFCISPFFSSISAQASKTVPPQYGVMAYVGLDGFLRIFDYFWWVPLVSYKSFFGGFNHVAFSEKGDLVALAGQDDNITVLDLLTMRSLVIQGHKSFVSKVMISEPEPNIMRVLASSLDSFLSMSEFDKRLFGLDDDNNAREMKKVERFPKKQSFHDKEKMAIKPLYFLKVSNDGLAGFDLFNDFLFIFSYDGVVSVWTFEMYLEALDPKEEFKNLMEIQDDQTKGPCFIDAQTNEKNEVQETVEDFDGFEEDKSTKIEGNLVS